MAATQGDKEYGVGSDPDHLKEKGPVDTEVGHLGEVGVVKDGLRVHPQPTADPLDPLNWSTWKKHAILAIVMYLYFMFTYITTTTVPSFPKLQDQLGISYSQVNWTVAIPALGLALGPLFWSLLADIYGRRIIFLTGTLIAFVATIGAAIANDYGGYMAARFFQGFGVSPGATVGMAVVSDLFFEYERGQKLGLWVLAIDTGLLAGPIIGGFMDLVSAEWIQWLTAILFGLLLILEFVFMSETLYPRNYMLARMPLEHSEGADIEKLNSPKDDPAKVELKRTTELMILNFQPVPGMRHPKPWDTLLRFVLTFKYPVVVIGVLTYCFAWYWWILSIITMVPAAYVQYSPQIQGLLFLGLLLGTLFSEMFMSGRLSDYIVLRLARRNHGVRQPEMRLWLAYPAALLSAIAAGIQMGNTVITSYIVDSYPLQSMSVITFYSVFLNLSAFANPFFIAPWEADSGFTWTFAAQVCTAGTIASTITRTIRDLSDLRATYTDSNVRIRLLIKELSTIKSSLSQINDWAHFLDETHNQAELKEALQVALDGVELAMGALAEEVRDLVKDAPPKTDVELGFRAKTNPSRPEQVEFLRAPQSRQIIQKVAEDTITLRNSMSVAGSQGGPPTILSHDDSTIDEKVFDIDDEIINSATYRRALHHNASKRNMYEKPLQQSNRHNVQIHTEPLYDELAITPTPSPTPSRESKPMPYENSVSSEPVDVSRPGRNAYIPLSSRSDVAPERHRPLAHRLRSSELGMKTLWSSLTPSRSSRNMKSLSSAGSSPSTPSTIPAPGSYRGRRGFENSSHASIDFGSENGLSAPSVVRAAQAGSVREVEMLLDQDPDVVEAVHQQSGRTALAVASHCGNEVVVRLLLQYGANVNARDASFLSPLHLAAMRGHHRIIEILLQEHVKVDELGPNDETALRVASEKGYVEVVALLLQAKAKVNARDRKRLRTPLHTAAINGDETMAELLVRHGAHIEAKDGDLMTPLHHACEAGKDRIVALLLNKKANPEALGRRGMTPVVCAAASGQVNIIEILLKKRASLKHQAEGDMTALHWAAFNGHDETVDFLLQKRAPLHVANKDGRTALHLAIMAGYFAVAELLIRRGAAIEAQCRAMKRGIHYACQANSPEIVQLLLGYNADPEVESSGQRPLHFCAAKGLTSIVNVLLSKGVDIESRNADGERALGLASRMGHLSVVRMLLDRGSRLRSKFAKGPSHEDSPLCLAARGGHTAVVQELVGRGTSVLQKDEQNWSPLRYASHYAHPAAVEFLLKAGATISGNPSSGWGFDVTAQRIGFANEVLQEEQRKAQVLKLLTDAEAKEHKLPDEPSIAPSQQSTSSTRGAMDPPAELGDPSEGSALPPQKPHRKQRATGQENDIDSPLRAELDTRVRQPSVAGLNGLHQSDAAYPTSIHIANAFGFDPFPQQRVSNEEPRQNSTRSNSAPAPKSVVQIGPDGMWRLNPEPSTQAADPATSIYELGP
ncbi:MAG: hypothetical protein Q9216_006001 [Gyalolechia sp. 2 TL-2023]